MISRSAWSTYKALSQAKLHNEILFQKQKKQNKDGGSPIGIRFYLKRIPAFGLVVWKIPKIFERFLFPDIKSLRR